MPTSRPPSLPRTRLMDGGEDLLDESAFEPNLDDEPDDPPRDAHWAEALDAEIEDEELALRFDDEDPTAREAPWPPDDLVAEDKDEDLEEDGEPDDGPRTATPVPARQATPPPRRR
jgi:hypothetical protein